MKALRVACVFYGLVLILVGVSISWFPYFLPTIRLATVKSVGGTAEIAKTYQALTAGPSMFAQIRVKITYPSASM